MFPSNAILAVLLKGEIFVLLLCILPERASFMLLPYQFCSKVRPVIVVCIL